MKKFLFFAMAIVAVGYSSCSKDAVAPKKSLTKIEGGKKDTIYKSTLVQKDTIYKK
jgi:hypothetical protein